MTEKNILSGAHAFTSTLNCIRSDAPERGRQIRGAALSASAPGHCLLGTGKSRVPPMSGPSSTSPRHYAASPLKQDASHPFSDVGQTRTLFTLLPASGTLGDKELEGFMSNFINRIKNEHPGLELAKFRGVHATTARRVRGIVEHGGFDFNRIGQNFNGHAQDGSGAYITDDPFRAIYYARKAFNNELENVDDGDVNETGAIKLQMLAFFEKSNDQKPDLQAKLTLAEQEVVTYLEEGGTETKIPSEALAGKANSYIAVPLPAFSFSQSEEVKWWLHKAISTT